MHHHRKYMSLLCLLAVCALGCQQGIYRASSLPPELATAGTISTDGFDLSKLGPIPADTGLIQPGDELKVVMITGDEDGEATNWSLVVDKGGAVDVPLVGPVQVAGLAPAAAAIAVRQASVQRELFRNPSVSVTAGKRRLYRVTVAGAVGKPGVYELPAGTSTLAAALAAAGGLQENASPILEVRSPVTQTASGYSTVQVGYDQSAMAGPDAAVTYVSLLDTPADSVASPPMRFLGDGTIVMVPERPDREITMIGHTGNKTLAIEPGSEVRLLDALAQSGGPTYSDWIANRVHVYRRNPQTEETATIRLSIRKAKRERQENILLAHGDIVSVEENVFTFTIDTVGKLFGVGATAARLAAY